MGRKVGKFEDLEIWKEGIRLATKIYRALNCRVVQYFERRHKFCGAASGSV